MRTCKICTDPIPNWRSYQAQTCSDRCAKLAHWSKSRKRDGRGGSISERRRYALGALGILDLISPAEIVKAMAMDPHRYGLWMRVVKARVVGPRCPECSILQACVDDGTVKCWQLTCPLRATPVSEIDLDRFAGELCKAAKPSHAASEALVSI